MSEQVEKLKATVEELEEELHSLEALDDDARQVLREAAREILAALQKDEPSDHTSQSLTDRLTDVTREFEGSHPTLAGIVSRLVDGLGQMGI